MLQAWMLCSVTVPQSLPSTVAIGLKRQDLAVQVCFMVAPHLSAVTAPSTIPITSTQPMLALTVQERPVISHKHNVSRATIKNAAYKIDGICYIIGGVDCFVCIVTSCHFIKDITSGLS